MDTFSAVAALAALLAGVSHLRYLKEHDYARRAILLAIIGILMLIVTFVWHFGFRLNTV
jgi:predicted acyltransferase